MIARKPPDKLYKYRPLDGENFNYARDIFTHNLVKFTRPINFNDPFESQFRVSFEASYEKQYDFIKSVIRNSLYPEDYKESQIKALNSVAVDQTIKGMEKQYKGEISDSIRKQNLVFSISETYKEILMWSHYADGHKGICIEVDTQKLNFGENTFLEYVEYTNFYPIIYPIKSGGKLNAEITSKILFQKSERWKYELEWRYVLPNDGQEVRPFPADAITGVVLGHNILSTNRDHVRKWAEDKGISVLQAKTENDKYALEFKKLPHHFVYKNHEESWNLL